MVEVIIRVDKSAASLLSSTKHYYGFMEEMVLANQVEMVFVTNDLNYLGRWLMMFAEYIEVVSPDALLEFMRAKIVLAGQRISKTC